MILIGWNRGPRVAAIEPVPADIAHVWRHMSDARRVDVAARAEARGITVEQYIRERFAAAALALFGPPISADSAVVNGVVNLCDENLHPIDAERTKQ